MARVVYPRCFGERAENKGVAGKECQRVGNVLKTNSLLGSTNRGAGSADRAVHPEWCAERAIRGSISSEEIYETHHSMGVLLRQATEASCSAGGGQGGWGR